MYAADVEMDVMEMAQMDVEPYSGVTSCRQ